MGMAAVTYLPRLIPMWALSSRRLPAQVVAWLQHVPVAVLSAMLLPALLVSNDTVNLGFDNIFLWASLPTLAVAIKTRSLFATVIVGTAIVALARFFFGL
jgi:branched-subunit amino acid transport protein